MDVHGMSFVTNLGLVLCALLALLGFGASIWMALHGLYIYAVICGLNGGYSLLWLRRLHLIRRELQRWKN